MVHTPTAFGISFSGAGFLGIYHLGAVNALLQHAPRLASRIEKFAGASAGSLAAAMMCCCPDKLHETKEALFAMSRSINAKYPFKRDICVMSLLEGNLRKIIPGHAHKVASGRLFISITHANTMENTIVSNYDDNEELMQALLSSCYIPFYAKSDAPSIDGDQYIDGGFSDFLPRFHDLPTITVSPFHGNYDICPHGGVKRTLTPTMRRHNMDMYVNPSNLYRFARALFPPNNEVLNQYFKAGETDCIGFLHRTKRFQES